MRQLFNLDGPVFEALNKAADIIILNLLFLLCSVPVVTIGASLTALSYVTLKMKDKEEGYVWKSFFRSFKQNFRQATLIWVFMLVMAVVLTLDFTILRNSSGGSWTIIQYLLIVGALLWVVEIIYVFPVLSRFYNSVFATMKNALLLALANAPKTLLMIGATVLAVVITLWNTSTFVWGLLFWMLAGFSLLSLLYSTLQVGIFRKFGPPQEQSGNDENQDPDHWEVT